MKFLTILLMFFVLFSCNQKEDTKPVEKTGVELIPIGSVNFGGIIVNSFRDAAVRVFNYGPEPLNTSDFNAKLSAPFYVQSVSSPCNGGSLPKGSNCIISIRFRPDRAGAMEQDLIVENARLPISGRGLLGGALGVDATEWDIGTTYAGDEARKRFTLTNLGDFAIPTPTPILPTGLSIGFNNCTTLIGSLKNCQMEVVAQKTIKGSYDELISFRNPDTNVSVDIVFKNEVLPKAPSGAIEFVSVPATIIADGVQENTVTTQPIRDQFGNIVADGTEIRINSNNNTLLTPSPQTTVGGVVSFSFRSPILRGFSTISLIGGDANGFIRMLATSGPPSGFLGVQSYPTELVANGQSQIVFNLLAIRDQFGNVVEDGTQIFYFVDGQGTTAAPFSFTLLGTTSIALRSPTTVGNATLQIRANPVYDSNNNIVSWGAQSDFPVTYVPGLPAGNIPLNASHLAIYADEDTTAEDLGIPIRSNISIGPVRDAHGNIVKENTVLRLKIENAKNITGTLTDLDVFTNSAGFVNLIIAGTGQRGGIKVSITGGAGAYGELNLWAFRNERISPGNNSQNAFTIQETFHSTSSLPPIDKRWAKFGSKDKAPLEFNDLNHFRVNLNNTSSLRTNWTTLGYLQYPCFFSRNKYIQLGFCQVDDFNNQQSFNFNALNDTASDTNNEGAPFTTSPYRQRHNMSGSLASTLGWNFLFGEGRFPGIAYIPLADLYMVHGGYRYIDNGQNLCHRYTEMFRDVTDGIFNPNNLCYTNGAQAIGPSGDYTIAWSSCWKSICNGETTYDPSKPADQQPRNFNCVWEETYNSPDPFNAYSCKYKPEVSFFGRNLEQTSYFFNMSQNGNIPTSFIGGNADSSVIGEFPSGLANMSLVSDGASKVFGFGGFDPSSPSGNGSNTLYVFTAAGEFRKWKTIIGDPDPSQPVGLGEPEARYQNGIVYVPDTQKVYIAGGLKKYSCFDQSTKSSCHAYPNCAWNDFEAINCSADLNLGQNCSSKLSTSANVTGQFCGATGQDICAFIRSGEAPYSVSQATQQAECSARRGCEWVPASLTCRVRSTTNTSGEGWTDAKDMWSIDVSNIDSPNADNPQWEKICDGNCGFPAGNLGIPFVYQDLTQSKLNPNPTRMNMIWHDIRKTMYIGWNNRTEVLKFDPFNETFSGVLSGAESGLANSFQLIYNDWTGKIFSYKRGTIATQINSSLNVFELNPTEKYYMKAIANVGVGAKQFASKVTPIVRGAGKITGSGQAQGIQVHIYNWVSQDWILVGQNSNIGTNTIDFQSSEVRADYTGESAREVISPDGEIVLLISPNGTSSAGGKNEMILDSVFIEGQF